MRVASVLLLCIVLMGASSVLGVGRIQKLKAKVLQTTGFSCRDAFGVTQDCNAWCSSECGAPCSACEVSSGSDCACDEAAPANEIPTKEAISTGFSCRDALGVTQDCNSWCTTECGAPCSACLISSGSDCACDAASPANEIPTKVAAKVGFSCTLLGVTQDCHVWCDENCGGPCTACETANEGVCACDADSPANEIPTKVAVATGFSCRDALGVTQDCNTWCTTECGAPCSACEVSSGSDCACDEPAPANDIPTKVAVATGFSCRDAFGVTQDCNSWCTTECGAPCSACELSSGNDCACDEAAPANEIPTKEAISTGFSCRDELGVTQDCNSWCTTTCGAPCSNCLASSGSSCACDDPAPAINDKVAAKVSFSCTLLGATQDCHVWCDENCDAPCSACESANEGVCACDAAAPANEIPTKTKKH